MQDPKVRFDGRFSEAGAEATPWAAARAVLESAQMFWITTVRADGRPHVTPLVAVWLDGALHFSTGPEEQKAVNIAGNPHVVLTTGTDEWRHGLDVSVEGEARRVTDRATLERLAAAWAGKWDGQWRYEVTDDGRAHRPADGEGVAHVFAVEATKILAFGKGPFSQTAYVP
ncbi:pyridoxamine 5'-phosphate oxidase family protein [Spirillospora sp. NPDC029432]|uniref:pyridoxamine 5'-phosphate oxidase family protein n=1 Tax=Spirillospora sp. NPDC029432 TaxID=3154599 RepID=UPI003451DA90